MTDEALANIATMRPATNWHFFMINQKLSQTDIERIRLEAVTAVASSGFDPFHNDLHSKFLTIPQIQIL